MVSVLALTALGYDPAASPGRVLMATASGVEYVPRLPVHRIRALGQDRSSFPVVAHVLPPSATIDGVLGLDFLRGQKLTKGGQHRRTSRDRRALLAAGGFAIWH